MKQKTLNNVLIAAALAAIQVPAYAVDTGIDWLKLSGFGTLAMTRASISQPSTAYFNGNFTSANGAQDSWVGSVDSLFGVQGVAQINPALSATLQVVTKYNAKGSYQPTAEWANLKYEFTPDISVRVGRVGLPAFLISDYLNVGYSHPWIRPPVEGYANMPMTHLDGADALFRFHAGETTISIQPAMGKSGFNLASSGASLTGKEKNVRAFNVVAENGPWTARYGNVRSELSIPAVAFFGLKDNFSDYGLIYDQDAWLIQSEYITRRTNKLAAPYGKFDEDMGYLTAGYRIGKFMPNLTFSRYKDKTTLGQHSNENTTSMGIRWDFYKNLALKAQYDHIVRPSGSNTMFGYTGMFNVSSGSPADPFRQNNKSINVLAVGLDFVF